MNAIKKNGLAQLSKSYNCRICKKKMFPPYTPVKIAWLQCVEKKFQSKKKSAPCLFNNRSLTETV